MTPSNGLTGIQVGRFWGTPEAAAPSGLVADHLASLVLYPDPGSAFGKNKIIRAISTLLAPKRIVTFLLLQGYGGMVFVRNGKIVGHVIGQKHEDQFHIFAINVVELLERNNGTATRLVCIVLDAIHDTKKFLWVRVGAGGNVYTNRIYNRIWSEQKHRLKVVLTQVIPENADSADGWFYLRPGYR